jgi:DNA-binding CsgD family transcriptional regulator
MNYKPSKKRILSFLSSNPCLTFSETARRLHTSFYRVQSAAQAGGINASDIHARKREAIVRLLRLNPTVPYYRLGRKVGLSYPSLSAIACGAGINRHVPRNAAAKEEREKRIACLLGEGTTFRAAAHAAGCSLPIVCRVAREHGIKRPGCPPLSYTKEEEERVLRWLRHPSMSYARIARKLGFRYHTVFSIASRSGVRRRPAPYYKAPEGR